MLAFAGLSRNTSGVRANAFLVFLTCLYGCEKTSDSLSNDKEQAAKVTSAGVTPLMLVALHGKKDEVRTILATGASVKATSVGGWSAVTFARAAGHEDIAKLLEASGATDPLSIQAPGDDAPMEALVGDPSMPALYAIVDYEGRLQAHPYEMEGSFIVNHGSIAFHLNATVREVNEVLKARGARIKDMLPGRLMISISMASKPGMDVNSTTKEFDAFTQVRRYTPGMVMTNGPSYVPYESCPKSAKVVVKTKGIDHAMIASCTSESFDVEGVGPVDFVSISHGKGMDCPSGCMYDQAYVAVDAKGHEFEVARNHLHWLAKESDLASKALGLWYYEHVELPDSKLPKRSRREPNIVVEQAKVITKKSRVECESHDAMSAKPQLVKGDSVFGWRRQLSQPYQCMISGYTASKEFVKLNFEVSGALETFKEQNRNFDDLVVREIANK